MASKEHDAWMLRVLGVVIAARADKPGTVDTGMAPGRGVAYRQLLLRWRAAQQSFDANLKSLGAAVLAHPDVQADPRIAQIRQAVGALPKLVPTFGGALEDLLDAAMNTNDGAQLASLSARSVTAIHNYRQRIAATARLSELETFAKRELGVAIALGSALDSALVELQQELAA